MKIEELLKHDQNFVTVNLDGETALAQLWTALHPDGPSVTFPDPAGSTSEVELFPLSEEDIEKMSLNGTVIYSHMRFTKEGRTRL